MHQSEASVEGTPLRVGQRIELSEGQAKVLFDTGAELQLEGPSILEVKGPNAAFLTLGSAEVLAESKESQGFTLGTPSSKFVDLGTAFSATVAPDGLSRLEVSQGKGKPGGGRRPRHPSSPKRRSHLCGTRFS